MDEQNRMKDCKSLSMKHVKQTKDTEIIHQWVAYISHLAACQRFSMLAPLINMPSSWSAQNVRRYVHNHILMYQLTLIPFQKTSKVAAPDPFTSTSQSIKEGTRKVGGTKLIGKPGVNKNRFQVSFYADFRQFSSN